MRATELETLRRNQVDLLRALDTVVRELQVARRHLSLATSSWAPDGPHRDAFGPGIDEARALVARIKREETP